MIASLLLPILFMWGLMSWSSKKKLTVAKSSMEVEYRIITTNTTEFLWLWELLKELGHPIIKMTTQLFSDNIEAT